jgi:ubiquinone/menaquinone biosynthesis C-methylase UbiE
MKNPKDIQREYYSRTASNYDEMHVHHDDEHYIALRYISSFINLLDISSILDLGCGTGRGVKWLLENHSIKVFGVDPVQALIGQAIHKNNIIKDILIIGSGDLLPLKDNSFDAICELGVLHHVPNSNVVVSEMMRVARKAIFLSDDNRFGQGSIARRIIKLLIYKMNLGNIAYSIFTRGKGYVITKGDGLAYSYSVFDSYTNLISWADRIILIPTEQTKTESWLHPLITSGQVLLCAIKDNFN